MLVCDDVSRIARDERDALDLIDGGRRGTELRDIALEQVDIYWEGSTT